MRKHETYNQDREELRRSLTQVINSKDAINHHLKSKLVNISTQKTNYSQKKFVKDLSIINAMLNKKFVHRKCHKRDDRVMFYAFLEKSKDKELLHTHFIMRVPKYLLRKLRDVFMFIKKKILPKFRFTMKVKERPHIAIDYCSKQFNQNNDNYFVF